MMARRDRAGRGGSQQAVGYVRVSTEGQAAEGISLEAQEDKLRAYCELHGLELSEVFRDEGVSAKRADNRPGLQAGLEAVCRSKGVLVVYSLTRLARSTRDAIDIVERLENCRADLASITERIDTTSSMGRFFFRLMASLGELERDQVSERTASAMGHLRRQNRRISSTVPFGFGLADDGQTLLPNPQEQQAIRQMQQWRQEGASLRAIAQRLQDAQVQPKKGRRWYASSVRAVLETAGRRDREG